MEFSKRECGRSQQPTRPHAWCLVALGLLLLVFVSPAGAQQKPCCSITNIDTHTGLVSANVMATGQTFEFRLNNATLASLLHSGQSVYASFQTKQVSLDGRNVIGTIVTLGSAPPGAPGPGAPKVPGVVARPPSSTAASGIGTAPCGAEQIPDVAGPIPPSAGPLDPLSAVNELQKIAWTNFSEQSACDAVVQLLGLVNQQLGHPDDHCGDAGCWYLAPLVKDLRPKIDIAAAPGIRYACLTQQDCPSGVTPGFALDVPLKGPGWTIGISASVGYHLDVWTRVWNPIAQSWSRIGIQGFPCEFEKDVDLTLSNIRLSETTILDTTDPSRPTLNAASVTLHLTLNLGGAIYTAGPQDLTLTATLRSGQMTFATPKPISASVNFVNLCGVAQLPANVHNVGFTLTWDPARKGVTVRAFGVFEVDLALVPGLPPVAPMIFPVEITQFFGVPASLLQASRRGPQWGENPPSQFWTQPASSSTDFATAAKQIESAILPHMPWGAILSIDHTHISPPTAAVVGKAVPQRMFDSRCPPLARPGPVAVPIFGLPPADKCYRQEFDSAIWTGHYLAAEAFRYAATQSQDALVRVRQVLDGVKQLFWVTEDAAVSNGHIVAVKDGPGLFSRTAFPSDSPLPLGDSPDGTIPGLPPSGHCYFVRPTGGWQVGNKTFPTYAEAVRAWALARQTQTPALQGQVLPQTRPNIPPRPVGRTWYGLGCGEGDDSPLSRDQYVGIFMGLAYARALVPDQGVQQTTSDLITKALAFLIQNNWDVRVPPNRRIPTDSNFLRAWDVQLGFLRIGASVNPNAVMPNKATLAQLYRTYAAGSKVSWIPTWATTLEPVGGGYFAFNLSHAVIGPTLLWETDPTLRQNFLLSYNMLRRATQHHKNAYFNAVSMLVRAVDPSQKPSPSNPNLTPQDELKGILQEWLTRRDQLNAGNGLPLNFVGDPSYQANLFKTDGVALYQKFDGTEMYLARYALPIYARNGDGLDFAWQRGAFEIAVSPPSANPPPGCSAQANVMPPDYRLGAGDLLNIGITDRQGLAPGGAAHPQQVRVSVVVDPGGQITLPSQPPIPAQLPPIPVSGLTVHEAQVRVAGRIGLSVSMAAVKVVVTANQIYVCGSDHANQEAPGVDYLLPYWMAAYLKIMK